MLFNVQIILRWLDARRLWTIVLGWASICLSSHATAQYSPSSKLPAGIPLLNDNMPPGMIGSIQLQRQPNLCGYFQPVELRGPQGMQFALVSDGMFGDNLPQPVRAAFLVGAVYRFRAVGIPNDPDSELFPTVEIIDRTYPPSEREHRFPIPIELDSTDIEAALRGELVTRVIYLEDSTYAEPQSHAGGPQRVFDVKQNEDTLRAADAFGRPLAILRIGSRIPDVVEGPGAEHFLFGSPPWTSIKNIPVGKSLSDISSP